MKWELDDNARSGFHYLLLGLVVIGLPALLFTLFDAWHSARMEDGRLPLGIFHNGYLIFNGNTTTVADTSRGERLAFACVIAFIVAAALTALLLLVRYRGAWLIGRWAFALAFVWCVFSALFLPRTSATITPGAMDVRERATIIGDITWPFSQRTTHVEWSANDELSGTSLPVTGITEVFRAAYYRVHKGDTLLFATTAARTNLFGPNARTTPSDRAFAHMGRLLYER